MRQIEFRAWDNKRNSFVFGVEVLEKDLQGNWDIKDGMGKPCNAEDITLQQFTGLSDSKMVHIFEGDIVRVGKATFEVVFVGGRFAIIPLQTSDRPFWRESHDIWDDDRIEDRLEEVKVIGNVMENPELLEEDYSIDSVGELLRIGCGLDDDQVEVAKNIIRDEMHDLLSHWISSLRRNEIRKDRTTDEKRYPHGYNQALADVKKILNEYKKAGYRKTGGKIG